MSYASLYEEKKFIWKEKPQWEWESLVTDGAVGDSEASLLLIYASLALTKLFELSVDGVIGCPVCKQIIYSNKFSHTFIGAKLHSEFFIIQNSIDKTIAGVVQFWWSVLLMKEFPC